MIKIFVDSTCNLSQQEANNFGYGYMPYNIIINNRIWKDGVDIDNNIIKNAFKTNDVISTSATTLFYAKKEIINAAKSFDKVFIITSSSKLSSQFNNLNNIAKKLDNVFVIDSLGNGNTILALAKLIEDNKEKTASEILSIVQKNKNKCKTFIYAKDKTALKKSGRFCKISNDASYSVFKYQKGLIKQIENTNSVSSLIDEFLKNDLSHFDSIVISSFGYDTTLLKKELTNKSDLPIYFVNYSSTLAVHNGLGALRIETGYFKK